MKKNELRKAYLIDEHGEKTKINFHEIKKGMKIKLYEPDGELVVDNVLYVTEDACPGNDDSDIWGFECDQFTKSVKKTQGGNMKEILKKLTNDFPEHTFDSEKKVDSKTLIETLIIDGKKVRLKYSKIITKDLSKFNFTNESLYLNELRNRIIALLFFLTVDIRNRICKINITIKYITVTCRCFVYIDFTIIKLVTVINII